MRLPGLWAQETPVARQARLGALTTATALYQTSCSDLIAMRERQKKRFSMGPARPQRFSSTDPD